ncbi:MULTISPECIES: hypothetical protein [Catenuloplanes]|uniref:Uncharacterized protein n=1 Tax=Catenuloplanes niger TaxID=587534 RepID=A0AAE3ZY14_9ACTN|nr:hypothetical protein [Catenuloplanes niger]MDR7328113.1 hypothetical protein [Catenuloplanes niger]
MRSVAVLALEADAQTAWLDSSGTLPSADEPALEFDDGYRLAPTFVEHGWLDGAAMPALARIDAQLDAMSGPQNSDLWHVTALSGAA